MTSRTRRWLWLALGGGLVGLLLVLVGSELAAPVTITVEWSTASELNTSGFNLYRGDNLNGPFERINRDLIPASIDPLVGGAYVFTDTQVAAGRTYYYRLEEVETSGATSDQGLVTVAAASNPTSSFLIAGVVFVVVLSVGGIWMRQPKAPHRHD